MVKNFSISTTLVFQRIVNPPAVHVVSIEAALRCLQQWGSSLSMSSEVHFVSCNRTMSGVSINISSHSIFCLLRPLRPLIFHDMIFMRMEERKEEGSCPRLDGPALSLP